MGSQALSAVTTSAKKSRNAFRIISVRLWRRGKSGLLGGFILMFAVAVACFAPWIAPHDPGAQQLGLTLQPGFWSSDGSFTHMLGTDTHGRDLLSRLVFGARVSLLVGLGTTFVATVVGGCLGLLSGYYRRTVDLVLSGMSDVLMAFPPILLAVVIVALVGTGLEKAMMAVAIVYIPRTFRVTRSTVLTVVDQEYIQAAGALGGSHARIIFRHVLPNVLPPIIVQATFTMAGVITTIAGLGFLGLGAPAGTPEWGVLLSEGRKYLLLGNWWYSTFPGLAIMSVVLGLNLLGDTLQEMVDPRLRKD